MRCYSLKEYNKAISLEKQGLGSLRISKRLNIPRGTIENWINKGGKPYYFSEKRINASNSQKNKDRLKELSKISQPLAMEKARIINTKKLKKSAFDLTKELAYVLGVIYGDGHTSKKCRRIILSAVDKDFVLAFKRNLDLWTGFNSRIYRRIIKTDEKVRKRKPQWVCYIDTIEGAKFLKDFNLNIIKVSKENIKGSFLKGLFDSEATVAKDGIVFYNSDEEIVNLVEDLLDSIGIQSKKRKYQAKSFNGKMIPYYHLAIYKKAYISIYNNYINFSVKRKQERLKRLVENKTNPGGC